MTLIIEMHTTPSFSHRVLRQAAAEDLQPESGKYEKTGTGVG